MELNSEENVKRIELEMMLKEWFEGDSDWKDMEKYREKCGKEWFDREVMCYVLREDVLELIDWDLWKLFFIIGNISLSSAVIVQNALKRLIDSMQNQLSSNSSKWDRHGKSCKVIEQVLRKCKDRYKSHDSASQQVYAQILDYMMKLIEKCQDLNTINRALIALVEFPFNKYQSALLILVDSIGNKSDTDHWGWQRNRCDIIFNVLTNTKELNRQTCDRLFDYLKKLIDCCEGDETIEGAWDVFSKFPVNQISSQVYQPLIQNYLLSSQLNWRMHQNWLKVLIQYEGYDFFDIFKENELKMWFEYLRNVLHECDHVELVSVAIKLVEVLCLREYFDVESEDVLKSELMGRVQSLDSECPLASDLPDEFDFDRYQVEWSARWCVHNVMDRHKRKDMGGKLPAIKLSNDRFEVRNDRTDYFYYPTPVRSQYSVTSGVYFHEITMATSGWMMCGLSTIDAEFDGLTLHYFNMSRMNISQDYIFVPLPDCHAGDVIGCLIDMDNGKFVFYCNGKEVVSEEFPNQKIFSNSPYYATALSKQHCYFNFGQTSFKFPPNHIQFMDFHKASGKDERKYRLVETCKIVFYAGSNYWFKHFPVDNQVDLCYRDKRQNECDELVKRVERDIEEGREVEEMKMELGCTRYIQAIIEEMGKGPEGDKVDVKAPWVGRVIGETIEDIKYEYVKKEKFQCRLVQQLYPYLHLRINSTLEQTKHRNICIVLLNLIRFSELYDYDFIKYIRNEVFTYLTRTLTETSDQWTQLFGLIALDNLKLKDDEKKMIQEDIRVMKFLNSCKNSSQYSNVFEMSTLKQSSFLSYQLHFMSVYFNRNVLNLPINSTQSNQSSLFIVDQTRYLKVSHDFLTIRSDWSWQSVRYECSGENRIDYFEVLLLTNGPMRIGWSTKRTELGEGAKLGADEFSISFNGHSRVMYHQNSPSPTHCMPQWKAGDVVACLMNISTGRFYFFLNGHPLPLPDKLYFSPHLLYYPSLSLSANQQVYCNFGQYHFKYPQPNIEHLELALSIQKSLQLSGQHNSPIDLSNSSFVNTILAFRSTNNIGNVTLSHQSQSTPIKPKLTTSSPSFITCPICHKHISTQRLQSDCCEHITYTVGPIPSTSAQSSYSQPINISSAESEQSLTLICQICHDSLTIVHAECCDHLKFCTKCGSAMGSCVGAKCNRK